jgi:uncharacterized protein (TIGR03086 family)
MGTPSGAIGLLAGAISYTLGVCALVEPGDMARPTPCPRWDLATLLGHLSESMADLETALRTGRLDLEGPPDPAAWYPAAGDPIDVLRDLAAGLLCAGYCYAGPEQFVAVGTLPVPAGLVVCTGAVEIAVHGWDVSAALGGDAAIPAALATRMLRLCPLLVTGREGLFAAPVQVPAQASPCEQLLGYLGRRPRNTPVDKTHQAGGPGARPSALG